MDPIALITALTNAVYRFTERKEEQRTERKIDEILSITRELKAEKDKNISRTENRLS